MVKPYTPDEAALNKKNVLPDFVIEAVNELLAKTIVNGYAHFTLDEVVAAILTKAPAGTTRKNLFDNNWMTFRDMYELEGWSVIYDRPGYNEMYEANYTFSRRK